VIAVDASALLAIVLDEPAADACEEALAGATALIISAVTVAEALIVAAGRNRTEEMMRLVDNLGIEIVAVTDASARRVAEAYSRWGKGRHSARLNFGDCFAYEVAKQHDCPLLFVGDDFAKTDVQSVLR
jgi:ribonuclease VapC